MRYRDPAADAAPSYVPGQAFGALPVSLEHAERAGQLGIAHRDPFDRMLIAQAQTEDMWLVSSENAFDSMGERRYCQSRVKTVCRRSARGGRQR
jgi:PIN domain nuclease of toxin-antitoxin system